MISVLRFIELHMRMYAPTALVFSFFFVLADLIAGPMLPEPDRSSFHALVMVYLGFTLGLLLIWLVTWYFRRHLAIRQAQRFVKQREDARRIAKRLESLQRPDERGLRGSIGPGPYIIEDGDDY